jgi:Uma2 family endonuclease
LLKDAIMLKPTRDHKWTYADYCAWPDDERWELIDGEAYAMVPAPLRRHQQLVGDLYFELRKRLEGRPCHVYPAPFDVRFADEDEADERTYTVVQPDISVFCREDRLDDKGARGAPDLVVEILSPSTSSKDSIIKRALYERHAVAEYWIVDPETSELYQFVLRNDRYGEPTVLAKTDTIKAAALEGVSFGLSALFG